jgi:hypothetical protein
MGAITNLQHSNYMSHDTDVYTIKNDIWLKSFRIALSYASGVSTQPTVSVVVALDNCVSALASGRFE